MTKIIITENDYNQNNLLYIQSVMGELFSHADCSVRFGELSGRASLSITCPEYYADIVKAETADKIAEIIAIKYKYDYFKNCIKTVGLKTIEKELLYAGLIAADFDEDKKYAFDKLKSYEDMAIDGIFNFRLQPLKDKWKDVVQYIPAGFMNTQLKEFISYLVKSKKKRVYIDCGKVYDWHYRMLKRSSLLDGDSIKIVREVLLSNCGEVELNGEIPNEDEYYLKEFYSDKIIFARNSY